MLTNLVLEEVLSFLSVTSLLHVHIHLNWDEFF